MHLLGNVVVSVYHHIWPHTPVVGGVTKISILHQSNAYRLACNPLIHLGITYGCKVAAS